MEDPVGPSLVDEHDRQTKAGHEGHNAPGCTRSWDEFAMVSEYAGSRGGGRATFGYIAVKIASAPSATEHGQAGESADLAAALSGDPGNQNGNNSQDKVTARRCQLPLVKSRVRTHATISVQDGSPAHQGVAGTVADIAVGLQSDEGKTLNQSEAPRSPGRPAGRAEKSRRRHRQRGHRSR